MRNIKTDSRVKSGVFAILAFSSLFGLPSFGANTVFESTRKIPVAYSVDVVVVGGSTHAVAAAASAARHGASVFLAAPRPYLGEDLCDALRLSLPLGQEPANPLAKRIFQPEKKQSLAPKIPFSYKANQPSAAKHRDTSPPSILTDGRAQHASKESVQYDADVTITVDLGAVQSVRNLTLMAFEKPGDYGVSEVEVRAGALADGCQTVGKTDERTKTPGTAPWSPIQISMPVNKAARYLQIDVRRPKDCTRLLLAELVVETDMPEDSGGTSDRNVAFTTTPHRIKTTLDEVLLEAGVQYLHGSYPTDVLVDDEGHPAGIVMANRAGRQAVAAKIIIDATERAAVALMAGAEEHAWPASPVEFHRTILKQGQGAETLTTKHNLKISLPDNSFLSFARAEQEARDQTYEDGQLRASSFLRYVPPDPIVCRLSDAAYQEGQKTDLRHFLPKNTARLFVLSGRADLPRAQATRLMEPCGLVPVGEHIGAEAARVAGTLPVPKDVRVRATVSAEPDETDVKEVLTGIRSTPTALDTVPSPSRRIPVLGEYDVLVVGGGTAGAAAGIGAARRGAKTLVVEYQDGLGGVGTLGLIGKPYHGRAVGFGGEVPFPGKDHPLEEKMEWYRRELRLKNADIWFGVLGCGVVARNGEVLGAIVATPHGRGAVLANTTIDATGNADLAVAAGADSMYGADAKGIAMQGTGLPERSLHKFYTNSDYLLVDETDMLDVWRALVGAKITMPNDVFDSGSLIQTRERRRMIGDHVLTYLDQIVGRTYPDSIVFSASDYDSHGYPNHPYFALLPHDKKSLKANHPAPGGSCYTPYRCLLPKGLDRMLTVGLGISMERDASAMVRMQRDISNQGYAAGVAAAMAAEEKETVRGINVRRLQQHLVKTGALPEEVLSHRDSFPLSMERIQTAVLTLPEATNPKTAAVPLATVLSHQEAAIPMLRTAYDSASKEAKLVYAKVLGMMGDPTGIEELTAALRAAPHWDDKIMQGRMAEYAHLPTPVDSLILALGFTKDPRALEPILNKLSALDADTTLSHHRAVALALERAADPRTAESLYKLLMKPGMRGHVMCELEPLHNQDREKRRRTGPLREIVLARALYRCGDHQGLGEAILRGYLGDIRGLFARHARAVLESSP